MLNNNFDYIIQEEINNFLINEGYLDNFKNGIKNGVNRTKQMFSRNNGFNNDFNENIPLNDVDGNNFELGQTYDLTDAGDDTQEQSAVVPVYDDEDNRTSYMDRFKSGLRNGANRVKQMFSRNNNEYGNEDTQEEKSALEPVYYDDDINEYGNEDINPIPIDSVNGDEIEYGQTYNLTSDDDVYPQEEEQEIPMYNPQEYTQDPNNDNNVYQFQDQQLSTDNNTENNDSQYQEEPQENYSYNNDNQINIHNFVDMNSNYPLSNALYKLTQEGYLRNSSRVFNVMRELEKIGW